MTETIWAVVITGLVSLLATYLGPLLAARAARREAAEERRSELAKELRPLSMRAIETTRGAIQLHTREIDSIEAGPEHLDAFDADASQGRSSLRSAQASARAALTELELTTDDPPVNVAVANLLFSLEALAFHANHERNLHLLGMTEPLQGQSIRATLYEATDGLHELRLALQPVTRLTHSGKKPTSDQLLALEQARDATQRAEKGLDW